MALVYGFPAWLGIPVLVRMSREEIGTRERLVLLLPVAIAGCVFVGLALR
jgi:hypothetical protein